MIIILWNWIWIIVKLITISQFGVTIWACADKGHSYQDCEIAIELKYWMSRHASHVMTAAMFFFQKGCFFIFHRTFGVPCSKTVRSLYSNHHFRVHHSWLHDNLNIPCRVKFWALMQYRIHVDISAFTQPICTKWQEIFKNLFPITHVNLNQIRYREALNSTSTWMSLLKTVRGRVSYCLERWHPSRRRIQRFPISDLVQIYVSDWKQVLKYVPLFWCRLVQRKLSRRVSYCKERRSRRRIQRFPIFELVQIYVSDWK